MRPGQRVWKAGRIGEIVADHSAKISVRWIDTGEVTLVLREWFHTPQGVDWIVHPRSMDGGLQQ